MHFKDSRFNGPPFNSVLMVYEFQVVFPGYLPGFPLKWKIDFRIDLLLDTRPTLSLYTKYLI